MAQRSTCVAFLFWLPPLGLFAAHRCYLGTPGAALRAATLNLLVIGWLIDLFLLPSLVSAANAAASSAASPGEDLDTPPDSDDEHGDAEAGRSKGPAASDAHLWGGGAGATATSATGRGRGRARGRGRGSGGAAPGTRANAHHHVRTNPLSTALEKRGSAEGRSSSNEDITVDDDDAPAETGSRKKAGSGNDATRSSQPKSKAVSASSVALIPSDDGVDSSDETGDAGGRSAPSAAAGARPATRLATTGTSASRDTTGRAESREGAATGVEADGEGDTITASVAAGEAGARPPTTAVVGSSSASSSDKTGVKHPSARGSEAPGEAQSRAGSGTGDAEGDDGDGDDDGGEDDDGDGGGGGGGNDEDDDFAAAYGRRRGKDEISTVELNVSAADLRGLSRDEREEAFFRSQREAKKRREEEDARRREEEERLRLEAMTDEEREEYLRNQELEKKRAAKKDAMIRRQLGAYGSSGRSSVVGGIGRGRGRGRGRGAS